MKRYVINHITELRNVGGFPVTTSTYDMGDRRTEVNHPASGITSFTYDALGNVQTKQTANLAKEGKFITYDYDYQRLTGINYPDHPENNVKYYYGGRTNTAKFSLYVSPYLIANQGGRYTKHIYIGSQRVVSKIGDFDSYGSDPRRIQYAGSETDGLSVDYKAKYTGQLQVIKDNYATFR